MVDMRKQLSQDENKGSVGTLARGLDILELFAGESPELTQTEISERLGLPVPTVHRLVKLLTERGWLVRDPATRRLRLGLGAARLLPAVRLPDLAREPLRALAERTGETANLATLDGADVLYLLSETGSHLLTLRSHVGLRLPVHATALGKCLLAQLDDDAARAATGSEPYERLTDRTVTDWSKLRTNLERIRREGVAHSREEFEIGLHSIAVPLPWMEDDGPVAVNVSLPASRGGRDATAGLVRELRATVAAISGGGAGGGRAGAAA
jgi:DNA-binding IclR family transcriptional regulator